MSPMSDPPVTVSVLQKTLTKALVDFHRDVIRPDVQKIMQDAVEASERRTSHQMDGLAHQLTNLKVEVKVGFTQNKEQFQEVNARLDRLEERMEAK